MQNSKIRSAVSTMQIEASAALVWQKVGFYEHVKKSPTWLLRLALPVPRQVEGSHRKVGDTCRCLYSDGGYLTKRITNIVDSQRVDFEIIEQSIRYQDTVQLLGGSIEVAEAGTAKSVVKMTTYYNNNISPQSITSLFVNGVIKNMHYFVMKDMQLQLQDLLDTSQAFQML